MSKTCAFFGNKIIWNDKEVAEKIRKAAVDLIKNKQVDTFLVGTKGEFEVLSHKVIDQIRDEYPDVKIGLVLAYAKDLEKCRYGFNDFYYPPASEFGYKRWSIAKRNEWIVEQTDYIIACNYYQGRAYNYCQKAKRKGKQIIEIGEQK